MPADFDGTKDMSDLLGLLPKLGVLGGWAKAEPSLWPSPRPNFLPTHWSFALAKAALGAAGRFVSAERADRRNLILANPVEGNTYATVRTIVSAYQMVKSGETAPSHRHSPNALRLIVEADVDAFTIVNGKRVSMEPGDIVLTPNWHWHGHVNESRRDAYWIDFLDVPTVHFLESMFLENHPDTIETAQPLDAGSPLRIPQREIAALLDAASPVGGLRKAQLETPQLRTMGLEVSSLENGAIARVPRTTANAIYAVMSGHGTADIDGARFALARGDVVAVPSWRSLELAGGDNLSLLRVNDGPMLKALGWLREDQEGATSHADR